MGLQGCGRVGRGRVKVGQRSWSFSFGRVTRGRVRRGRVTRLW